MTQTFDLNKMGLSALSNVEMQGVDGGEIPTWMKGFGVTWIADQIITNWEDIKAGFTEGYNASI